MLMSGTKSLPAFTLLVMESNNNIGVSLQTL